MNYIENVCNIADDTTPYACDTDLLTPLHNIEHDVIAWFDANYMKHRNETQRPMRINIWMGGGLFLSKLSVKCFKLH